MSTGKKTGRIHFGSLEEEERSRLKIKQPLDNQIDVDEDFINESEVLINWRSL